MNFPISAIWSPEYCAAMLDVMENLFNDEARDTRLMRKNALYPLVAQRINQAISTKVNVIGKYSKISRTHVSTNK